MAVLRTLKKDFSIEIQEILTPHITKYGIHTSEWAT
jgi:hypothetical protein